MIRVGILGCASIARRSLAPAFAAHGDYVISRIASRTIETAAEFAAQYRARPSSYEQLVQADDVDLVYCPLPTGLHHKWVGDCLAAGKHVLCEKSLACSLAEVDDLVKAARSGKRFLMESFQFRFHAQNSYVRELLSKSVVGEIRQVVVRFGFPPFPDGHANIRYSKALGGGAFLDAGAYAVKAATYLLGSDLEVVAANAWTKRTEEVDLGGSFSMVDSNGVVIDAAYGFDNAYQCGYEIWGSKGLIKTTRAFTAPVDFPAEVMLTTVEGMETRKFPDNHFSKLLDHVSATIASGDYENEYVECLNQARLLEKIKKIGVSYVRD